MAEPRPKPVSELAPREASAQGEGPATETARVPQESPRDPSLDAELLAELRRMNRLLSALTRGPRRYTLSFFSGIVRGLGAAIGATVVFALAVGVLSRVDTIPLIGTYLAKVYQFAATSNPAIGEMGERLSGSPEPTPDGDDAEAKDGGDAGPPTEGAASGNPDGTSGKPDTPPR